VEITRQASRFVFTLDGRPVEADAVEVSPGVYSLLLAGQAFEVRVDPGDGPAPARSLRVHTGSAVFTAEVMDPRTWSGRHGPGVEAEGAQQVTAPMPGKIVRVLVEPGAAVEAGQGLVVVEAMKMQNEVRSSKSGKVEKVLVREGQAVNSGEVLAIVV